MKKEYDFSKMKKREGKVKVIPSAKKTSITLRVDSLDLGEIKVEALRMGIPYQTFISSILHRYVAGDLVDKESPDVKRLLNQTGS
jgi:predicted DNA binding CopG/RHH family protein